MKFEGGIISTAFQTIASLNGQRNDFYNQFKDYKTYINAIGIKYKMNHNRFLNEWNEVNYKDKLSEMDISESVKNPFPDLPKNVQWSKDVNGKTIWRIIPDAQGNQIINKEF